MKSRGGFVSNSSTSSFVILGVGISDDAGMRKITEGSSYTLKCKTFGCPDKFKRLDVIWGYNGVFVGKVFQKWQAFNKEDNTFTVGRDSPQDASDGLLFMRRHPSYDSDGIKKALEPLGLWDEDAFGVYCGTVND